MVFAYELKIPKNRIAVLIGKSGSTKKDIEENTETKININSQEGDILIEGEDALKLHTCKDMITAIGRGFNPEYAKLLLKQDYAMELINLNEYSSNQNSRLRLKGRVIGQEGKTRKYIESLTLTYIVVQGKTICIIGEIQRAVYARRAVEQLLKGSAHKNVYRWLEQMMKQVKTREILLDYSIDSPENDVILEKDTFADDSSEDDFEEDDDSEGTD